MLTRPRVWVYNVEDTLSSLPWAQRPHDEEQGDDTGAQKLPSEAFPRRLIVVYTLVDWLTAGKAREDAESVAVPHACGWRAGMVERCSSGVQ